jgi:superoxide reductase
MTAVNEVYVCEICGNKVRVVEAGVGVLVCCGEPMQRVDE